jgi:tetratricopeptide (TPR) repeat protein
VAGVTLLGHLFGQLFGDSASESEARGDQFAAVNNWRRAHEEYQRALQKSSRGTVSHRRIAAKVDEARVQSFDSLLEDIHSRIDVREYTYATEQIEWARDVAESQEQLERLHECEARLQSGRRQSPRRAGATPGARVDALAGDEKPAAADAVKPAAAVWHAAKPAAQAPGSIEQRFRRLLHDWPTAMSEPRAALGPSYQEAALALADGEPGQAVEVLQTMLREKPDADDVVFDLGVALDAAERPQEAVDLYAGRIDHEPHDWRAWYELGQLLWRRGRSEDCLQCLRQGLEHNPRSGHLMAQWGVCLYKLGRPRQALEKLYQALQLDEFDDVGLYHTIANLHRETNDRDKARRAYLKALELDPGTTGTMLDYAEMLLDQDDASGAQAILDTLFRSIRSGRDKRSHQVYASYLASRVHMALGEREMALLAVTRAVEDNDQGWLAATLEEQRKAVLNV